MLEELLCPTRLWMKLPSVLMRCSSMLALTAVVILRMMGLNRVKEELPIMLKSEGCLGRSKARPILLSGSMLVHAVARRCQQKTLRRFLSLFLPPFRRLLFLHRPTPSCTWLSGWRLRAEGPSESSSAVSGFGAGTRAFGAKPRDKRTPHTSACDLCSQPSAGLETAWFSASVSAV